MNRLQQDAWDELHAHEIRLRRPVRPKRPTPPTGCVWFPKLTDQERIEREQQIAAGWIPF